MPGLRVEAAERDHSVAGRSIKSNMSR
jgi:hypothetical protein